MSMDDPILSPIAHSNTSLVADLSASNSRPPAILLSSYGTGANHGKNLGVPGYSHDIVMQLYAPLLEKWGTVIFVEQPHQHLEAAIIEAREQGLDPIHLSVIPCQDTYLSPNAPNVLMPAWEFPDIPNHTFDFNPQNDWRMVAARCDALFLSGPFTANAFYKSGVETPIHLVQVPTPESYFEIPEWRPQQTTTLDCRGYRFVNEPVNSVEALAQPVLKMPSPAIRKPATGLKLIGKQIETVVRKSARNVLGEKRYLKLSGRARKLNRNYVPSPEPNLDKIELSGVVYTSIFNPNDGRKNWTDLITSFLAALGDHEDATLVVKLVTRNQNAVNKFLRYYSDRDIPHRCQLIVISDYLTEAQLCELASASTYYLQTTKAEGNCLPLMNYLAAGRPGVSPCHSAISDYFNDEIGFTADSHQEPAAWPHDSCLRARSTWARLVWPSMVQQIRESYRVAKEETETYQAISRRARQQLHDWASPNRVEQRLIEALTQVREASRNRTPAAARYIADQIEQASHGPQQAAA